MFDFMTAGRIVFGPGRLSEIGRLARPYGQRALVFADAPERATALLALLADAGIDHTLITVTHEPSIDSVQAGAVAFRDSGSALVISLGGGSTIDTGKAVAALATNPGDALDYLEVIGKGQKLTQTPAPFIAIPTTAGTGAEVTMNAVLYAPAHKVKVSLRHPDMLPRVALVDPELTYSMPPAVTAATGMDALTQVLEPYVSRFANPMTDALALEGLKRGGRALRRAYHDGENTEARVDMALTSLFGGLALANAKLGAVHGFAGVLGGMYDAPHGAVCARLLPPVMDVNVRALQARAPEHPARQRFDVIAHLLTGQVEATAADGVAWVSALGDELGIAPLSAYGVTTADFDAIIAKSAASSSMKGNPIDLTPDELAEILHRAL